MAIRGFQLRALQTRWLKHAAWIGPFVLAAFAALFVRGGYPRWRIAGFVIVVVVLLARPVIDAHQKGVEALSEPAFVRAWLRVFLAFVAAALLTGGLASPFTTVFVVLAVSVNVTFGAGREGRIFSMLILAVFVGLVVAPRGWFGPALGQPDAMGLRVMLIAGGIVAVRSEALALAEAFGRASTNLDRLRENVLADARLRASGLDSLGARVAHEVKNPLAALKALLQLVARSPGEPRAPARLEAALGEVARLEALLREYLSFSKPFEDLRPEPVALGRLADDVVVLLEARARERGVRLSSRGDAPVTADPRRLREALVNVVTNAVEATPSGGRVEAEVRPRPDGALLVVRDTGEGISLEHLPQLGETKKTTREGGTGLGVALARAAVLQHGGTIDYASERGRGTTVTITLPREPPPARSNVAAQQLDTTGRDA